MGRSMQVGIGQSGFVRPFGNVEVDQLAQTTGRCGSRAGNRRAQLAGQHGRELLPAVEALGGTLGLMLLKQTGYLCHQGRLPQRFQSLLGKVILKPPMPEGNHLEKSNRFGR
jgi:hypothetical protein